ncbi:MAG: DUF6498-containing protein, partial [Gemmatimonadota bacterium]|nr:DUF6498-containing protein [Gemmatimonadota bacterium]
TMIVWSIIQPAIELGGLAWRGRAAVEQSLATMNLRALALGATVVTAGGLFVLAFFTFHFGGFHYIHSQFLISFFPIDGEHRTATVPVYLEVARRYWWALPSAFVAERGLFMQRTFNVPSAPPDVSVTAEAITRRKAANLHTAPPRIAAPYARVMRMHVLIILFGALHFARLEGFAVYAFVYALYFFPWRLLRRDEPPTAILDASRPGTGSAVLG